MFHKFIKSGAAAALLCGALVSGSALANEQERFDALQGIEAQTLSVQEMDAIHGARLTAQESQMLRRIDTIMKARYNTITDLTLRARLLLQWSATMVRLTAVLNAN